MDKGLDFFFATAKVDIEKKLKDIIKDHDEKEKLEYFLRGGKRLRPLLCLLAYRVCCGGKAGYGDALELAAAIELQHSASLVHDDIIDRDATRRGALSYYRTYGIEDAILTGHRAIVLGFKNALHHDPKIIMALFNTWDDSLKGEIKDIESRKGKKTLTKSRRGLYFDVILKKTASLFAGAALIGSQEAGAPKGLQRIFWEFGKCIGMAYQLIDDCRDIDKGKEILPIAWILGQMDGKKKASFISRMGSGELPSKILTDMGANPRSMFLKEIAKMQACAQRLANSKIIPDSEFKPLLIEYPEYFIRKCMS